MKKLLVALAILAGCDSPTHPPAPTRAPEPGRVKAATHPHDAPHGGTLVELGDHAANLEVVVDAPTGRITAYVLDGHADQPIRLEQREIVIKTRTFSVALQAVGSPLTGEKPGDSSQFEGQSDSLKGVQGVDATVVRIVVKGREFADVSFRFP